MRDISNLAKNLENLQDETSQMLLLNYLNIRKQLSEDFEVGDFPFTDHQKKHCRHMEGIAGKLIAGSIKKRLKAPEIAVLLLAIWIHDLGMFVQEEVTGQIIPKREDHHKRVLEMAMHLSRLQPFGKNNVFYEWAAKIGYAHGIDATDLERPEYGDFSYMLDSVRLRLLAVILRLSDILDVLPGRSSLLLRKLYKTPKESWLHHKSLEKISGVDIDSEKWRITISASTESEHNREMVRWRAKQIVQELKNCKYILAEYEISYRSVSIKWEDGKLESYSIKDEFDGPWRHVLPNIVKNPYQGVKSFNEDKAGLFFGRDNDLRRIVSLVRNKDNDVVLLKGICGVGKTSLIQAHLIPCLKSLGFNAVYVRLFDNPTQLTHQVKKSIKGLNVSSDALLSDFLANLTRVTKKRLIIFIDQFEEFFELPTQRERNSFIEELRRSFRDEKVNICVVFVIRSELLHHLDEFNKKLPGVIRIEHTLYPLGSQEATLALEEPAKRTSPHFEYESGLIDNILKDISPKGEISVRPIELSIIATTLYNNFRAEKKGNIISFKLYKELHEAEGILVNYLNNTLTVFSKLEAKIAKALLKNMISFEGAVPLRSPLSITTFVEHHVSWQIEDVKRVANDLVNRGILKPAPGEKDYELGHEYLVSEIKRWFTKEDIRTYIIEKKIETAFNYYRQDGTTVGTDQLDEFYQNRTGVDLSLKEIDFLLKSAKKCNVMEEIFLWLLERLLKIEISEDLGLIAGLKNAENQWISALTKTLKHTDKETRKLIIKCLLEYHPSWEAKDRIVLGLADLDTEEIRHILNSISAQTRKDFILHILIRWAINEINSEESLRLLLSQRLEMVDDQRELCKTPKINEKLRRSIEVAELINKDLTMSMIDEEVNPRRPWRVRFEAVRALGQIGTAKTVSPLLRALDDENDDIQSKAAFCLSALPPEERSEVLFEKLSTRLLLPHVSQRRLAARILGNYGDKAAVKPLIKQVKQEKNASVRREIYLAIKKLDPKKAVKMLVSSLRATNNNIEQSEILTLLSELGEISAKTAVLELCNKPDISPEVKDLALIVIKKFEEDRNIKDTKLSVVDVVAANPVWGRELCRVIYRIQTVDRNQFRSAETKLSERYGSSGRTADAPDVATILSEEYNPEHEEGKNGRFTVSFPRVFKMSSISELLTMIAGFNIGIDEISRVRIDRLELSPEFVSDFKGPMSGINDLSKRLNHNGPFLNIPIYPRIGLSDDEHVERCRIAAGAGADIVAENELLFQDSPNNVAKRVSKVVKAIHDVQEILCNGCSICNSGVSQTNPMYFVNITGTASSIVEKCKAAAENGADGFILNILTSGFSVAEEVTRFVREFQVNGRNLSLFGYFNMHALITQESDLGIDYGILLRLGRLIGIDIIHIGVPLGMLDRKATSLAKHLMNMQRYKESVTKPWFKIRPCLPALAGGISWNNLQANVAVLGKAVCVVVGSGSWRFSIKKERPQAVANIKRMKAFLSSNVSPRKEQTRDFLRQCPILKDSAEILTSDLVDVSKKFQRR